jgi:hypothetical protein
MVFDSQCGVCRTSTVLIAGFVRPTPGGRDTGLLVARIIVRESVV